MWHMHQFTHSICKQNTSFKHTGLWYRHIQYIHAYIYSISSRNLVTQLQDVINKLASSQNPQMSQMSIRPPSEGRPEALVIPNTPEPLDEDEYPDVPYWHDEDWVKHSERQKDCGEGAPRLGFLTDADGNVVSESRIKVFTTTVKQAWNELYRHRLDPSSWTRKTPKAASYDRMRWTCAFPLIAYLPSYASLGRGICTLWIGKALFSLLCWCVYFTLCIRKGDSPSLFCHSPCLV
jgi:hypothetical protein